MRSLLLAFFTFALTIAEAKTYYFSTTAGDDSRSATQAQNSSTPWKTISKLNSIFNTLVAGDAVLFRRGETFYGTIVITKSRETFSTDYNNSITPITVGAYGTGLKPIITGLQAISNWTSIGNGIYESPLTQNSVNLVSFQDSLQPIGRWPKVTAPNAGYLTLQSHAGSTSITSNAIATAKNFTSGELVVRKWGWIIDRGIISNQNSTTVTYTPNVAPLHPTASYEPINGFGFFFQNHVNALTDLGDWMYDKTAKKVKMYFGSNTASSYHVEVPTVEHLVNITSSSSLAFDNLSFKGANGNTINLDNAYNIQITNCDLNLAGVDAIAAAQYGRAGGIIIRNCNISNTNNNAISAWGTESWIIQNNKITNTGVIRGMGVSGDGQYIAIASPGTKSLIEFNEIKNTGYNAIEFKGDSTIIKNNFIDNFCTVKSDGGGIYNSGESDKKGRKIISNIVINGRGDFNGRKEDEATNEFAGNVHGIYMDGGATDIEISNNTAANCSSSGLELSSPRNTKVLNNTLYNNTYRQIYYWESAGPISNLTLKNNILVAANLNELVFFIDGASNTTPNWGVIDSNYYCRPLFEPDGVNTIGWSNGSLADYPDGGIVQTFDYKYLSLDVWRTYSKHDVHSKKSPIAVSHPKNIRFEYNATTTAKTVTLDTTYVDIMGNEVTNSVTIQPYSSVILFKASRTQTIDFAPLKDKKIGDPDFALNATASSGLPVSFRVIEGPATIENNMVTIADTVGTVIVEAYQPGNEYFYRAPVVRHSFEVTNDCTPPTFVNNGLIVLDASCSNNDGNLNILPLTGEAPFMYSKDGGVTYVKGADAGYGFQGLSAGTYKLRLKDATGCESAVIERVVKLICANTCTTTFENTIKDAGCDNNDGSITMQPTSGQAPFRYSINGGLTYTAASGSSYTFNNLAAGTYRLRIKDATDCESQVVETAVKLNCDAQCTPPTFVNNGLIILDASCANNDGNISILPLSGIPPFMYSINGGTTYVPGPDGGYGFMNLPAGTYKLRLKDSRGCESAIVERSIRIVYGAPCGATGGTISSLSIAQQTEAVTAYPNPTKGKFKLILRNLGAANNEIAIINGEGKVIENRRLRVDGNAFVDFDLSARAPGLYYIKISNNSGIKTLKVIVQ